MIVTLLGALAVFLVMGVPVAVSLGLTGVIGMVGTGENLLLIPQVLFSATSGFELAAIPLFILMSQILLKGGVGDVLFEAVNKWVGHLPGGLAIATVVSCAFFAAITGSSSANALTIGTVAIPAMQRRRYPPRFVYGLLAGAGTLGILIPPSIPMILYGAVTGESVGKLYTAGVVPGVLLGLILIAYVWAVAVIQKDRFPRLPPASTGEKLRYTLRNIPALTIPVVVLGGMYAGVFTPTEAAGIGAAWSLILCMLVYRTVRVRDLDGIILASLRISSMILLIVGGAFLFGHVITLSRIGPQMVEFIVASGFSKWAFIVVVSLIWIFMGDFLEPASIILITVPILYPVVVSLGIDPIWFGILMVINMELACITPPVGFNLYVIMGVARTSFEEVLRGTVPFMVLITLALILVMVFPALSLWLPGRL